MSITRVAKLAGVSSSTVSRVINGRSDVSAQTRDRVEELLAMVDALPPGNSPLFLRAQSVRFAARLAARREGPEEVAPLFARATDQFRALGYPFPLATCLLEHGEWLLTCGRQDEAAPLLDEAATTFERLGAKPWIERTAQARHPLPSPVVAAPTP